MKGVPFLSKMENKSLSPPTPLRDWTSAAEPPRVTFCSVAPGLICRNRDFVNRNLRSCRQSKVFAVPNCHFRSAYPVGKII